MRYIILFLFLTSCSYNKSGQELRNMPTGNICRSGWSYFSVVDTQYLVLDKNGKPIPCSMEDF